MSNPQDSPKTLEELVDLLRRIYNPGAWTQRQLDAAVQLIQSFIDAQKPEVSEGATDFAKRLYEWSKWDEEAFESRARDWAKAIAARDQKLVQEAVKPWVGLVKMHVDALECAYGSNVLRWPKESQALVSAWHALLSQPQEVK